MRYIYPYEFWITNTYLSYTIFYYLVPKKQDHELMNQQQNHLSSRQGKELQELYGN